MTPPDEMGYPLLFVMVVITLAGTLLSATFHSERKHWGIRFLCLATICFATGALLYIRFCG